MTRQEFLDELRQALQGEISQGKVNEHIRYYENYIMEEARKGKSEQQVIDALGNPRLIAKTLVDTTEQFGNRVEEDYYSDSYTQGNQEKGFHVNYSKKDGWNVGYGKFKLNSWYGKLLMIAIAFLIIFLVASLVAFLLPIVIPVVLILLILSLIFGSRR